MGIRIIDANAAKKSLLSYYSFVNENTTKANYTGETLMSYEVADMIEDCMDNTPTIDPETLPVVQDLRKQLEQVTAERDAAVKELEEVTKSVDDLAEFVDSEIHPSVDYGLYLALRENVDAVAMFQHESEWRGPVAENATAGNGGQSDD